MGWLMVRGNFFILAFGFLREPIAPHLVPLSAQPEKWTARLSVADRERSSVGMTSSRVFVTDHWILGEYCLMRCMMGTAIPRRRCKVFDFKNFICRARREVCRGVSFLRTNRLGTLRWLRFERCFLEAACAARRRIKYPARMHASAALVRNLVGRATRARPSEGNERVTSVITSSSVRSIEFDLSG
jgi:hypothetical protein